MGRLTSTGKHMKKNQRLFITGLLLLLAISAVLFFGQMSGTGSTGSNPNDGRHDTAQPTAEEITLSSTVSSSVTTTETATETPSASPTVTATETVTPSVTSTSVCLQPGIPSDSAEFGPFGRINFDWTANVDAAAYLVQVTSPTGLDMTFRSNTPEYSRYVESFPWGGEYTWQVVALDANGNELCRSISSKFTKPLTEPSQTAVPRGKSRPGIPVTPIVPTTLPATPGP